MAVEHVEVDEVGEDQAPAALVQHVEHRLEDGPVVPGLDLPGEAALPENARHLADGEGRDPSLRTPIRQRRPGWRECDVLAGFGPDIGAGRAHEGARDHAGDAPPPRDLERLRAEGVQLRDRKDVLVRRHLEHAVGARVDDGPARAYVLLTQTGNHLGAAGYFVPQPAEARLRDEGIEQVRRERVEVGGKGLLHAYPCELPVPCDGVLAGPRRGEATETRRGLHDGRQAGACTHVPEPERGEVGQRGATDLERMEERVRACIAPVGRVGQGAHAHAVRDEEDDPTRRHQ